MTIDEAVERKAAHDNQQHAVLRELQYAHQVILAAAAIMTPGQKLLWAVENKSRGVPGKGAFRFHERAVAIFNATGEC